MVPGGLTTVIPTVWTFLEHQTSLSLSFLPCKMELMVILTPRLMKNDMKRSSRTAEDTALLAMTPPDFPRPLEVPRQGTRPLPTSAAHGMRDTWLCGPSSVG